MRASYPQFVDFIKTNIVRLSKTGYDQPRLREFYKGKYDPLPAEFNWKPYWGYNALASIVHFHGPKPIQATGLAQDINYPCDALIRDLYLKEPDAYSHYVGAW